jgi:hypothetical protein
MLFYDRGMKYEITYRKNGLTETTDSLWTALRLTRSMLNVDRVYRGAEYQTDRPQGDDREPCTALDIWIDRRMAASETPIMADAVISWRAA